MRGFDFSGLFIFEMANNHQGDVDHGLRIIDSFGKIAADEGIRAAMKLQMRDLPAFVHPDHRAGSNNKHVGRFLSTRLTMAEYDKLVSAIRDSGLIPMCTPFDEVSVQRIVDLGIDVLKIGSPSATDWPLIEAASETGLPVIFSTGGLSLDDVDDLVSFFDHRKVEFALMHCVSIYPTPTDAVHAGQVAFLRNRFPGKTVGYSGHEDPDDFLPVKVATALGAELFERHVGVPTSEITLNAYSLNPDQARSWIRAQKRAAASVGNASSYVEPSPEETRSLHELRRGMYARRDLAAGDKVERSDVYFAMPSNEGQIGSGAWVPDIVIKEAVAKDAPLDVANASVPEPPAYQQIYSALHAVRALLNEGRVALPSEFELEISHHYGMENFREVGVVLIDCVNRAYCKKVLVQLPGQRHPLHYHRRKEETFQVLHGILELEVDDRRRTLYPGDTLLVLPGVWHSFWTETGVVFEEISTTHYVDDSFYADKSINHVARSERKTTVKHWGRHQLGD